MDFNFSDEQVQLGDAVGRWADKAYTFDRRTRTAQAGGFSKVAYQEMAELGLAGLMTNADFDGMDMGPTEAMVALEKLGSALVLEPIAHTWIASVLLDTFAPAALKAAWLPQLASGEVFMALATQEKRARYRLDVCAATATPLGDGHAITGSKHVVAGASYASALLVNASIDGVQALFLVASDAQGLRVEGYATQDGGSAGEVYLDNTPATLVSTDGLAAMQLARDMGIACLCAEGVGVMEKTLTMTTDYMNTRKQFGVEIAKFQALRHRVADVKMQLELARSMSYYATLKLGAPAAERSQAMSRAKVQLGNSMRFVGQECIQLHGGIGVTDEYAVSHYFKRLTQMEMSCGDTMHHVGEVSARMQDSAGVFA
ncbi:MAG: acyl-CoA dehydrogenase family protein [Burkholderiales bacterium]|nr:Acyl-CoA dehydrogenase [Betaproteobacteria bacterium MOLA814]